MTKILGQAEATAEQMAAYMLSVNPEPKISMTVMDFCQLFLDTAAREGVRGDALFAQSCKETGNFAFNGTVKPDQNNFAGLGTVNISTSGAFFPDAATGILAQAQHVKAYATVTALSCTCVDPRYSLLARYGKMGTAPHWEELGGKWAVPGFDTKKYASLEAANAAGDSYGYQVVKILEKIVKMQKEEKTMERKPIIALDAGHGMNTAGKRCLKKLDPNETREWWLNDRIADMVEADLKNNYECTVLRVGDTSGAKDISLSARVKAANDSGADVYVSIHHNAGIGGKSGGGTVVFYSSGMPERPSQAQRLYDAIVSRTGLRGNRSQNVVNKGFYVIKNTKMPSFLVENGFMDSTTDTPIILTQAHAEKTAQGILTWLVAEFNLTAKTGTTEPQESGQTAVNQSAPAAVSQTYTVVKGDTLSIIGKKLGVAWKDIASANGIRSPYTIKVGQKLSIPGEESIYYPSYTGKTTTLSAALISLGITSTYSYRKQIAAANGIKGYMGTAAQNTQMYNLLAAGLLKRV